MPLGRIDHSSRLSKTFAAMYMDARFSDVTIKAGGESFPAHGNILATQSPYFEQVFYTENQKEVAIGNSSAAVFRELLAYFYTGKLELKLDERDYIAELMKLVTYLRLQPLHHDVTDDLCAVMLGDGEVPENILHLYDQQAEEVMGAEMFKVLPPERVQQLLARDTFYVENELDVFRAVTRWGEGRPEAERKAALGAVRLALIPRADIFSQVRPTNAYSKAELFDAVEQQEDASNLQPRRRSPSSTTAPCITTESVPRPAIKPRKPEKAEQLKTIVAPSIKPVPVPRMSDLPGANVASPRLGAHVISGSNPEFLLSDEYHAYSAKSGFTWHKIKRFGNTDSIVVRLDKTHQINTINLHLQDDDFRFMSYTVEVATDMAGPWSRVVDYANRSCRGRQLLYFEAAPARYVKLTGTACTLDDVFAAVSLQCRFTERPLTMAAQGVLEPDENQALVPRGAVVLQGGSKGASMLGGVYTDASSRTHGQGRPSTIEVGLPQPVRVGSMRFKLRDLDAYTYQYCVDVSADRNTWVRVAEKTNEECTAWQTLEFDKKTFSFIRFIHADSKIATLSIMYLECPNLLPR